ncbi:MAG: PstS family phosphate ABC transporter substrate-binding protein [Opitutales bacterium]
MKLSLSFCLFTATTCAFADIIIAGSDLLEDVVEAPLEAYNERTGTQIELVMGGSLPAEERFEKGAADLIIVAEPEGDFQAGPGVIAKPLAFLIAVIAVNAEHPLEELSLNQLRRIFAEAPGNRVERWSDLGVQGARSSGTLRPVVLFEQGRILNELFRSTALDRAQLHPSVQRMRSEAQVVEAIATDINTVAVLPKDPATSTTKVLRVAVDGDDEFAFDPDADNIYYASYPLRLPFFVVFREEDTEVLNGVLQMLYSADFAEVLEDNGFVALPENLRQRVIMETTSTR